MSTRGKFFLLSLLLTVAVLSVWLLVDAPEPEYLGHPISYWIEPWHHHASESAERESAAIAAMDERAVRWLARQLDWRPSLLVHAFAKTMNSVIGDFMSDTQTDSGRREAALTALTRLGPRARSAIPEIEAVSRTTVEFHREQVRGMALGALIRIREEPLQPYIERLKTAKGEDWAILTTALAAQGTNAVEAVPILTEALNQHPPTVWLAPTIYALGSIHSHPELSIPTLIHCLEMTNAIEHQITIQALTRFGSDAKPAWPYLVGALTNSDASSVMQIERALLTIDPGAASKMGIK